VTGVARATLFAATLELRAPVVAADRVHDVRTSLFLRYDAADGATGWGECPTASAPGPDPVADEVRAALAGALAGAAGDGAGARAASSLVRAALDDLELRRLGVPLASRLGVRVRDVGFAGVVGEATPAKSAERARALVALGASRVRVKVSPRQGTDAVRAVLEAVDVPVVVDANGSLEPDHPLVVALRALPIAWLEQPFAPGAWRPLAALARTDGAPLGLDESVDSLAAIDAAATAGVAVVCVKPSRFGGADAVAALARAPSRGVVAYVGGQFEAGLGRAQLGALSALGGHDGDVVAPSTYLVHDPCGLPGPVDRRQPLHEGPGVGPPPADEDLEPLAVCDAPAPSARGRPT
jgi:L-alanine-DL-glutamate epimerase-like enolase superfamily enzyme